MMKKKIKGFNEVVEELVKSVNLIRKLISEFVILALLLKLLLG